MTDYESLIYAFNQKPKKCSPRKFRRLNFISQFTTSAGIEYTVADTVFRLDFISILPPIDYNQLATAHKDDLSALQKTSTGQGFKLIQSPGTNIVVDCDVST